MNLNLKFSFEIYPEKIHDDSYMAFIYMMQHWKYSFYSANGLSLVLMIPSVCVSLREKSYFSLDIFELQVVCAVGK